MDTWDLQKDYWLLVRVSDEQLLEVVARYAELYPGDSLTILWLASRGNTGHDHGGSDTEKVAYYWGGYRYRPERSEVRYDCNGY